VLEDCTTSKKGEVTGDDQTHYCEPLKEKRMMAREL